MLKVCYLSPYQIHFYGVFLSKFADSAGSFLSSSKILGPRVVHGAHPAALESYRALGIGNCLKKIMSTVLEERLNTFLTQTGALSHEQLLYA